MSATLCDESHEEKIWFKMSACSAQSPAVLMYLVPEYSMHVNFPEALVVAVDVAVMLCVDVGDDVIAVVVNVVRSHTLYSPL